MSSWSEQFTKPYRHRHAWLVIKLAVLLHVFLSSRDVRAILHYLFCETVAPKTICEWAKKFPLGISLGPVTYTPEEDVILFTDEKYVKVKSEENYWWSIRDHLGRVLATLVTTRRDGKSATELFRRARARINGRVHAVVHDGLASYDKPVRKVFGRKCESVVAGIQGKQVMINNHLYWITNNSAESLNAQIDAYYARHHYNFNSLESANNFATMFLYRMHLREACT